MCIRDRDWKMETKMKWLFFVLTCAVSTVYIHAAIENSDWGVFVFGIPAYIASVYGATMVLS